MCGVFFWPEKNFRKNAPDHFRFVPLARLSSCHSHQVGREALKERNLQPGEEPLDADLVFAASGCAYAAQRSLERELQWAGMPELPVTGPKEPAAKDGHPALSLWWRSLWGRTDWNGSLAQRVLAAAKYLLRAASMPLMHSWFLVFLASSPLLQALVRRDPRLQERHLHRFVNRQWHRIDRVLALQAHYRLLLERWSAGMFEAVYGRGRATLGSLQLKDGSEVRLHLRPPAPMSCEGELTLELTDAQDQTLYRLVMTLIDNDTLAIGCIQGPTGDHARETVRELTRNMHGMRPKQLMLVLAYAFAGQCGLRRLLAVGNGAHPLRGRTQLFSDYDGYWLEQGGTPEAGGWFLLPATLHHRSEAELESKRRALFRRRAELRWEAVKLLNNALRPVPWWRDAMEASASMESPLPLPDVTRAA